jgi:hypothetical protein
MTTEKDHEEGREHVPPEGRIHREWRNDHGHDDTWAAGVFHCHQPGMPAGAVGAILWPEEEPPPSFHPGYAAAAFHADTDPGPLAALHQVVDRLAGLVPAEVMVGDGRPPMIHAAMAQVVATVEAVAKGNTARMPGEGSYKFRGIADLMTALSPAWGNAGIYVRGREVGFDVVEGITTSNNKRVTCYLVRMEYDFTARDGSMVTVGPYRGEGRDTMDKALGKAYSMAYKKMLEETFCVPFADSEQAEEAPLESAAAAEAPPVPAGWEAWADHDEAVGALRGRAARLPQAGKVRLREGFLEITGGMDPADQRSWWLPRATYDWLEGRVSALEHGRDEDFPASAEPWASTAAAQAAGDAEEELGPEGVPDPSTAADCDAAHPDDGAACTLAAVHTVAGEDHETFDGRRWPVGPRPVPFTAADTATRDAAAHAARGRPRRSGAGDQPAWTRRRPPS